MGKKCASHSYKHGTIYYTPVEVYRSSPANKHDTLVLHWRREQDMHQQCSFNGISSSLLCLQSEWQNNQAWWTGKWPEQWKQTDRKNLKNARRQNTHASEEETGPTSTYRRVSFMLWSETTGSDTDIWVCPLSGGGGLRLTLTVLSPRQTLTLAFFCPYKANFSLW